MNTFITICLYILFTGVIWQLSMLFLYSDSRFQKRRFRIALDRICEYITNNTKKNHPPVEMNIIYKNKKFAVGIIKEEVNYHYSTYRIFINGDEAACYHQLKHMYSNSYHFEEINKRHRNEVEAIIYAANTVLKQAGKPKKEKKDGYTEYSYFK